MRTRTLLLGALFAAAVALRPPPRKAICASALPRIPTISIRPPQARMSGRIVLASLCDKLFDIDEKLNIVPQLALSHETSEDGKTVTIKLRPNVKFHDGEPFDAEAAKFTLDRHMTMQGSFRKAELSQVDKVEVVDPLTIRLLLKAPFSPLIAQLTDRAGMMVSPEGREGSRRQVRAEADLRRTVQIRRARRAGAHRARSLRRLLGQGPHPPRSRHLFRDAGQHRAPRQPALRRARPDGAAARDRHPDRARRHPAEAAAAAPSLAYTGLTINLANTDQAKNPLGQNAKVRQALELTHRSRCHQPGRVQRRVHAGQSMVGADQSRTTSRNSRFPKRNVEKAKALIKEAGVATPITRRTDGAEPDRREAGGGSASRPWRPRRGFDLKIRLTEFATSLSEGTKGNFQVYLIGWSGRVDPDQNVINHLGCNTPFNWGKYCSEKTQAALNEARTFTDPAKRKAAYEAALTQIEADRPLIYIYHQALIFATTAKLDGYRQPPGRHHPPAGHEAREVTPLVARQRRLLRRSSRAGSRASLPAAGIDGGQLRAPAFRNCRSIRRVALLPFACPPSVCLTGAKCRHFASGETCCATACVPASSAARCRSAPGSTWCAIPSILPLLKAAGLDFARVDMEHSSPSMETIADMALVARAIDFPIAVRPPTANREWITRLLDVGVWNLHCPQVEIRRSCAPRSSRRRAMRRAGLRGNGGLGAGDRLRAPPARSRSGARSPIARCSSR